MSMKLIGIFITLCALAGAGGYYYFFVVEPQRYVAAVSELKRALDEDAEVLTESDIGGQFDYRGALDIVLARHAFLEKAQQRIGALRLPSLHKETQEFHVRWRAVFEGYREANADAEERAKLLAGFSDIGFLLEKNPKLPFEEKTAYVRDMQSFFEKTFGGLKKTMEEVMRADAPPVNDAAQFEIVKSLWAEAGPALDIMLGFLRAQDSNAKLAGYSPRGFTSKRQYDASAHVTKFGEALKKFLEQNTAYDILAYRYFEEFDEKVAKPAEQTESTLEVLEAKYAK